MTLKYELTKMYHSKETIEVCRQSLSDYLLGRTKELEHILGTEIVSFEPLVKFYRHYAIGYCPVHNNEFRKQSKGSLR